VLCVLVLIADADVLVVGFVALNASIHGNGRCPRNDRLETSPFGIFIESDIGGRSASAVGTSTVSVIRFTEPYRAILRIRFGTERFPRIETVDSFNRGLQLQAKEKGNCR